MAIPTPETLRVDKERRSKERAALAEVYSNAADELERSHPASKKFSEAINLLRKEASYWRNVR